MKKRIALGVLAVLLLAAGALAIVFSRGAHQQFPRTALLRPAQQRAAPAWTAPCWPTARWTDKDLCVHVAGRVVWIQRHDPDGDGDRHLIVVARLHPRIVKLEAGMGVPGLPRIGTRVDAVGWLMRGGSGHEEVNAQRIAWGGRSYSDQAG